MFVICTLRLQVVNLHIYVQINIKIVAKTPKTSARYNKLPKSVSCNLLIISRPSKI